MSNRGLQFEWCIFHYAISKNKLALRKAKDYDKSELNKAADMYKSSGTAVQKDAKKAIEAIQKKFGTITQIIKMSGGSPEPKTDLIFICKGKKIKCSLKYGGSIQLSSAGVATTVKFLDGVVDRLSKTPGYDKKKAKQILGLLTEIDESLGSLGKMTQNKANKEIGKAEGMNTALQQILGSTKSPQVSEEYQKFKLAIIEEAITGKMMFDRQKDKACEYIVSENGVFPIDKNLVKKVAEKTSVRLALKGRGKETVGKKEVRLNEIVVRFDTKS